MLNDTAMTDRKTGRTRQHRMLAAGAVGALVLGLAGVAGPPAGETAAAAPASEVVATTTHASYTETGTWAQARDPGYQGGRTRYTREAGATATWTLELPADGSYQLDAWYTASTENDKVMTYGWTGAAEPVTFDQSTGGGSWRPVGTVEGEAGEEVRVTVTAVTAGAITRTDAIRLSLPRCDLAPDPAPPGEPTTREFAGYTLTETPDRVAVETEAWAMRIERAGFRYALYRGDERVAAAHPESGLLSGPDGGELCGVVSTEVTEATDDGVTLRVVFADGLPATVTVRPEDDTLGLSVVPTGPAADAVGRIVAQVAGGMNPAYGLGDDGGARSRNLNVYGSDFDEIYGQNGGPVYRFVSTFTVFPDRGLAQVVFDRGRMSAQVDADATALGVHAAALPDLRYFFGDLPTVYAAYQDARADAGYVDAAPDYDFFGVGYESYGALAYNTNQQTITQSVTRYLDEGYPLRWAVTGSGFWPYGPDGGQGTTSSFGMWGEKYPDPDAYKEFFAERGIDLILGLRQSFKALPEDGGKYDPALDGPWVLEGLEKGYFIEDAPGEAKVFTTPNFPGSPIYLVDPDDAEAVSWFADLMELWGADGYKEDHMFVGGDNDFYDSALVNAVNEEFAERGDLVMVRNSAYSVPGSILRINDTDYNHGVADRDRTVVNSLAYAASGQPNFYPDIVGGRPMPDLETNHDKQVFLARNAMFAAVSPSMSFGNEPWRISDPRLRDATLKAARWHDRYLPYIYSAAAESMRTGFPSTATPLPIAYPDDPATYDLVSYGAKQYQWMLGPSLLVHPLFGSDVTTAQARDVYLPAGEWMDLETGERHTGPVTLEDHPQPVGKVPAFVGGTGILTAQRDGAVVAEVYPVAPRDARYTYTAADGETTSDITAANTGWDAVRVLDTTTGAEVPAERDAVTGAVVFAVVAGHDYQVLDDACPDGDPAGGTIVFGDQDSGVPNRDGGNGCTFLDEVRAAGPFDGHGAFVRAVVDVADRWRADGLLSRTEHQAVLAAAARSEVAR
ncbi:TIM-barrel domain-containing protein [Jiangella sp. DSM 45060]|uniref:golvesin C-terminal-like domain-containing protein n=1 Tax=Jiangella sp. DSM 45060 TaxID=1798224 RepID=UPI00087A45F7|nr:TIM-barrel domain-containing protein [Jiangella sp. DSM 45060]SDT49501.1 Alpha-glucosidase, glycosyl hydrolase family GH31 [Jiangella sp. DSM 45060]